MLATTFALCAAGWTAGAYAEEPAAKSPPKASAPKKGSPPPAAARPPAAQPPEKPQSASGATETIALEIVAKAPKPIPPVELDMLQLRLMLTDLKASFTDKIDEALFHEPF